MQQYEVEYLQFAFRWMNNLLMRELPLRCTIRLWDTYQVQTHTAQSYCYCASIFFFWLSLHYYLCGLCMRCQKWGYSLIMAAMIGSEVVLLCATIISHPT